MYRAARAAYGNLRYQCLCARTITPVRARAKSILLSYNNNCKCFFSPVFADVPYWFRHFRVLRNRSGTNRFCSVLVSRKGLSPKQIRNTIQKAGRRKGDPLILSNLLKGSYPLSLRKVWTLSSRIGITSSRLFWPEKYAGISSLRMEFTAGSDLLRP